MNELNTWHDFFLLAKRLRDAQKNYFRTKSRKALDESRDLERRFDDAIKHIDEVQFQRQYQDLF